MPKKASKDLLELVNYFIKDKLLFLSKTTEDTLEIIKVLDDNTNIPLKDEDSISINDSY